VEPGEWSEHELREHIRSVIADIAPIKGGGVKPSSRLTHDLGFDSLGLIELVMTLEHELQLPGVDEQTTVPLELAVDVENLIVASALPRGPVAIRSQI